MEIHLSYPISVQLKCQMSPYSLALCASLLTMCHLAHGIQSLFQCLLLLQNLLTEKVEEKCRLY